MGHFKTFLLGMAVAYGIYYLTKKRENGTSLMDEMLDNPSEFVDNAKNYAIDEAIRTVKEKLA
jgi:hypothetical protein